MSDTFVIPSEPRRETIVKFVYDMPGEGYLARGMSPSGYVMITRVTVTLDNDGRLSTDDSGPYMDYDCYGVNATAKGKRDKRSGTERKFTSRSDHAWIGVIIADALAREGWTENEDGTYTVGATS